MGKTKEFIFRVLIIVVLLATFMQNYTPYLLQRAKPSPVNKNSMDLHIPYEERVGKGIYKLLNRDPIKQVLANSQKVDLNLRESLGEYRWVIKIGNGTTFSFGKREGTTVMPAVMVRKNEGSFVRYSPQEANARSTVVKKNIIEWIISDGVIGRYTMKEDRVKADYIVNKKESFEGRLVFDFETSGNSGSQIMPNGDIAITSGGKEIFTVPKPVIKDKKGSTFEGSYELSRGKLTIVVSKPVLEKAAFPITIDPVVIDNSATSTGTAYSNGRKILRDHWGNLLAFMDGGTGNDNVYYKDYNSTTWVDTNIDLDGGTGSAVEISADLDSTGSAQLAFRNTSASAIQYMPLKVTRDGTNAITAIGTQAPFSLDTTPSNQANRPSLVVANKGISGAEAIAVVWSVAGTSRGEVRFLKCLISTDCTQVVNWSNASSDYNGSGGVCADTGSASARGMPNAVTCRGAADKVLTTTSTTTVQAVLTQIPGRQHRSPAHAMKYINAGGTYTNLTNAIDGNSGTNDSIGNLVSGDYIYIGDSSKFSKIAVDIGTNNSNMTAPVVSYWDGSTWATVSDLLDETANDGTSGCSCMFGIDNSIQFNEPYNWQTTSVNGVNGYWIRISKVTSSLAAVADFYLNDRLSYDLMVVAGNDASPNLGVAVAHLADYTSTVPNKWEHYPTAFTARANAWQEIANVIDTSGAKWSVFTNFPLSTTVDTINNSVSVGYMSGTAVGSSDIHIKTISNKRDPTVAANWMDAALPSMTEAAGTNFSLTSDGQDLYMFYVLNPGTTGLVYRKCTPSNAGIGTVCDNTSDWGSETAFDNTTTLTFPQVVFSKATGDTNAIDVIYTNTTGPTVSHERQYVNLADKTVTVAASGDDAYYSGTTDTQIINSSTLIIGGNGPDPRHGGIRFSNVVVPQGAAIASAYIDFRNTTGATVSFTVYGEDTDNASAFTAISCGVNANCIGNRTKTISSKDFSSTTFSTNDYRIDVTNLIQEIVCRGASNAQPCVGTFNKSGNWVSGNALSLLFIGSGSTNITIAAQDGGTSSPLLPTLQINLGVSGKSYSLGSATQIATGSASFTNLDHPFSTVEYSTVASSDNNYASVSASLTSSASTSAQPVFMFKENNSNNNNTYKIDAAVTLKSTIPTSTRPVYLQVYRGGSTNNWVTMATDNATVADTNFTLTSPTISNNLSDYYFAETPGLTCSSSSANCWTYWRVYQDPPSGATHNETLAVDQVNISYSSAGSAPTVTLLNPVNITDTSAIFESSVNPNGLDTSVTYRYDTANNACGSLANTISTGSIGSGSTNITPNEKTATGLMSNQTYYYCATATNANGTTNSGVSSFSTATAPSVRVGGGVHFYSGFKFR